MQIPFNNLSIIINNIHKRLHALLNQPFFINEPINHVRSKYIFFNIFQIFGIYIIDIVF